MESAMIAPNIFQDLQRKIDDDTAVKETLRNIVQQLEKQTRATQAILSRAHATPTAEIHTVVAAAQASTAAEVATIGELARTASQYPYYKFNYSWSRQMESACLSVLLCGWLGGFQTENGAAGEQGRLMTIEDVGRVMGIPVNLKDRDAFHLTIEEYLLSLISLIDELARLARNSVTLGDFARPQQISRFVKDVHAGFQILNLKNDALRKRSDGIKYRVKEVEDVVYDLSLRGLLN